MGVRRDPFRDRVDASPERRRPGASVWPAASFLLFVAVLGCGSSQAAQPAATASTSPPGATTVPTPISTPTPSVRARPTATSTDTPIATVALTAAPVTRAWVASAAALRMEPQDARTIAVHLGPGFPVALTSDSVTVGGVEWRRVAWITSGAWGDGWLPASSLTTEKPSVDPSAGLDALDPQLEEYVEAYGSRVGVDVDDVTRGVTYSYNASKGFYAASSMKVPIMLTLLSQLEDKGREPNSTELRLLTSMIEISSNSAAHALYAEIGDKAGIAAYMRKIGVGGIVGTPKANGFGYSTISPAGMVALLDKLRTGKAVNENHTALALRLMSSVIADQRIGVGDSSPPGAQVALKDGWVEINDGSGTSVMNSSGIVTVGAEVYVVAVYTDKDHDWSEGQKIAQKICRAIGAGLVPPHTPIG